MNENLKKTLGGIIMNTHERRMELLESFNKRYTEYFTPKLGTRDGFFNLEQQNSNMKHDRMEFVRDIKYVTRHHSCDTEYCLGSLKVGFPKSGMMAGFWQFFTDVELLDWIDLYHFWHIENERQA